ncbi:sugar ABC transporter ATP-binding protein [Lacihabitans sp. LS3-19]|uniref:sugar ABC transporter ATP-binding protein n=1 Tax=Lacihabitans sp. LS3-19 TaxID=2487335 RepID=UPI0020CD72FD|nr:sugar ABC transporter ATP-binding protein [Lacihabitans sp. LS3-19]MCP9770420.1 sugar ABC transporter ATP-binding protein [Lacihabitans sp. LS3-19]
MLQAVNISKSFPGVKVLQGVNFNFYPGKVNAILGENGAGKSTLLKVLTGVYTDYEGEIILNGNTLKFDGIKDAQAAGIGIIHQELNLIPHLSISENLFLGNELRNRWGLLDSSEMEKQTKVLLAKLKLDFSPKTLVQNLKVGEQQLLEIARALLKNSQVILMDEPTSALTDSEIDNLHVIIEELKAEGKTIVYISHKMDELFRIAQHYTVLRDGVTVDAGEMSQATEKDLIKKMVGRDVLIVKKEQNKDVSEVSLSLKNIFLPHPVLKNRNLLDNISFDLHKGEILGVFGLMGAGRTELLQTIFGLNAKNTKGEIEVFGKSVKLKSPKDAIASGIAYVTEDRKTEGLVLNMNISTNIGLTTLKIGELLNFKKEKELAQKYISEFSIKTPSEKQQCQNLSGGNQQKVVLSKWMATQPEILMLDEPTRGIDIKAKSEIYELIKKLANDGKSILLISSEIPEVLALSDRILVLSEGKISAEFNAEDADENKLLKAAI